MRLYPTSRPTATKCGVVDFSASGGGSATPCGITRICSSGIPISWSDDRVDSEMVTTRFFR